MLRRSASSPGGGVRSAGSRRYGSGSSSSRRMRGRSYHARVRILQLGPLYNNHLRRWSAHARALGHTVVAAGHVRPGRLPLDVSGLAEEVVTAPGALYGGPEADHLAWLGSVLRRLEPDLVHGHWLPKWP